MSKTAIIVLKLSEAVREMDNDELRDGILVWLDNLVLSTSYIECVERVVVSE